MSAWERLADMQGVGLKASSAGWDIRFDEAHTDTLLPLVVEVLDTYRVKHRPWSGDFIRVFDAKAVKGWVYVTARTMEEHTFHPAGQPFRVGQVEGLSQVVVSVNTGRVMEPQGMADALLAAREWASKEMQEEEAKLREAMSADTLPLQHVIDLATRLLWLSELFPSMAKRPPDPTQVPVNA